MDYVLGIDVGTSFTAAAVARFGQGSPAPECLPLGLRGTAVPSVVYYPEEGPLLVGEAAERRSLDYPGRAVREFKRRVGDAVPISVGGLSVDPEDVFATMTRWVVDRATEREGAPPSEVILTHPAAWGSHRTSLILAALAAKSLDNVTLVPEPEAAALYYASQVRVEVGSTIGVYDLGGGTFDTAVLRKAASNRFQLVGRPEGIENLGGADFDAEVFRYVAGHTGDVLSTLNPADAGVRAALGRLRRECVEAKEALSSDSEANISVLLPGFQQQIRLVRSEFEALIEDSVRDTVEALEQSLAQLELEPADLSAVLLIGGSSRIPLVAQLISEQLDRPIAVDADPKSSICLGAALSAVLARAEAEARAAAEELLAEAAAAIGLAPDGGAHVARLASWSRKSTTAAGAPSGAAASVHGHGGIHGGAHAPKPTVRLTAIAAAAALVSVLTATAAQGPAGFSNLASVFVPEAGAAPEEVAAPGGLGDSGGSGGGSGAVAAAAGTPLATIEARVNDVSPATGGPGLTVDTSPASQPAWSAAAENWLAAGGALALDGPGVAAGGGAVIADAGSGAGTTDPAGTPVVAVDPVTGEPVPVDPVTGEPVPPTDSGTPTPVPSSEPAVTPEPSSEPAVTPEPSSEPAVTPEPSSEPTGAPEPSSEATGAPAPSSEPTVTSPAPSSEPTVTSPAPSPEPTVTSPSPGLAVTPPPATDPAVTDPAAPVVPGMVA
ncbi:molecular chaperone DnaK [Pseudarthrobacter siccitolerans]|uniref:Molecular chaperone DnaK n=1 Tax=Pseudarthrobacter siccitolerans TaxID=861266 RepID=A0ABU0PLK6_9MICC|nr:Hsp70 family protein [Pseudarthrobacter siccitolerans]MDQ0674134.1 molecular chaperone DnaK [Pseudarthrobacter siccitolerans]